MYVRKEKKTVQDASSTNLFKELSDFALTVLSFLCYNAEVARAFSSMNIIKNKSRNRMTKWHFVTNIIITVGSLPPAPSNILSFLFSFWVTGGGTGDRRRIPNRRYVTSPGFVSFPLLLSFFDRFVLSLRHFLHPITCDNCRCSPSIHIIFSADHRCFELFCKESSCKQLIILFNNNFRSVNRLIR